MRKIIVALIAGMGLMFPVRDPSLHGQSTDPLIPANPAREHIRLGGRLVAVDTAPEAPNQTPIVVLVSPTSGTGSRQTFQFLYSDPDGFDDILVARGIVVETLGAPSMCQFWYSWQANALHLLNDANDAWLGPVTPGSAQTLQNSRCRLDAANSTAWGQGSTLWVTVDLKFFPSWAGPKGVWGNVRDAVLNDDWTALGAWTVPDGVPIVHGVTPSSGTGASQVFAMTFSDADGHADIDIAQIIIHDTLTGVNACYAYQQGTSMGLASDFVNGQWHWLGPITVGSSATLENSWCRISGAGASVSGQGDHRTVAWDVTFLQGYTGEKFIWGHVSDATAGSGWALVGSWTVP